MDKSLLRLNLQLFATTMTTETGSLSAEMKTFYEKRLLDQGRNYHHTRNDFMQSYIG